MKEHFWQIVMLILHGAVRVVSYVILWLKFVIRMTVSAFTVLLIAPVVRMYNAKRKKVKGNAENA